MKSPDRFVLPSIAFPKLRSVIETYYLAGREKPDEYFGCTELALFAEKQSGPNKVEEHDISGCVSLLEQIGIIIERDKKRKYRLTGLGEELGQKINDQLTVQESELWSKVIPNCSFLSGLKDYISQVVSKGQKEFKEDIVFRSGGRTPTQSAMIGAKTIISILEKGGFITIKDKDRSHKIILANSNKSTRPYISSEIISSLRTIKSKYDLSKLIKLCEEINDCYYRDNFYAVGLLNRTILNHVPPIFGSYNKFVEVLNNYPCSKSFRAQMQTLEMAIKIADDYAHGVSQDKEILANSIQVNFSPVFDVFLREIIKILS